MVMLTEEFHGATAMALHGLTSLPFMLAMAGVALSWFFYLRRPDIPAAIQKAVLPLYTLLDNKYYFDEFNEVFFAGGARLLGRGLWQAGDRALIDGLLVNGSARIVGWLAGVARRLQTGHIYQYAFGMIFGVFAFLTYWYSRG
jgi:NADH-quinone oxidoreductase subunit L